MSLKMPNRWEKNVRVNADATVLKQDKKDPVSNAMVGAVVRAIGNQDTDYLADLQTIGKMFQVSNPVQVGQTAIGRVTRTTLTDTNKGVHQIDDDPALVTSYVSSGMTITKTETLTLYDDGSTR